MVVAFLDRVHHAAVRVPGDAMGAVRNRRERHGEKLVPRREALPGRPPLEVLDDRPDGVRTVVLRVGDIELEAFHVAYRNGNASVGRLRLHIVHRINLRHEHVGDLHERPIAGNVIAAVHHVRLACDARGIDRLHAIDAVVYLLRCVVHRRIVADVPRQNRRMPAEGLDEIRSGNLRTGPGLESMAVGKVEKFLCLAGGVGMDEVEAPLGDIAHSLCNALAVQWQRAQTVKPDREERLSVNQRDAIVAQRHLRRVLCHLSAEEHLLGGDGRAVLRILQRHLRRVEALVPFSAGTVGQDCALARESRRGILAVERYLEG